MIRIFGWLRLPLCLAAFSAPAATAGVVLNEIAWAGSTASGTDEWIELLNAGDATVLLDGWRIESLDLTFRVDLAGPLDPGALLLLERRDDDSVPCVVGDIFYDTGQILNNTGIALQLIDDTGSVIDEVDAWHAGDSASRATMERVDPFRPGTEACNWRDGASPYCGGLGLGTPAGIGDATRSAAVVLNEIAWAGNESSAGAQWVELLNRSPWPVSLEGWSLEADGLSVASLRGRLEPGALLLLETEDGAVPCGPEGGRLRGPLALPLALVAADRRPVDLVDAWHAGSMSGPVAMERVRAAVPGREPAAWGDARVTSCPGAGLGTPAEPNAGLRAACAVSAGGFIPPDLRFTMPLDSTGPETTSDRPVAQALLAAIEASTLSVHFALHEVRGQDAFLQALLDAQARGVDVRCVLESEPGQPPSGDGEAWSTALGTCVWQDDASLMHHKFFVIDGSTVWTGSTNLTETGIGGEYNHNASLLLDSVPVAAAFEREHEEMWLDGLFSTDKSDDTEHVFCFDDGTRVELYFSPSDGALSRGVLPVLRAAQDTLDVASFFLTSAAVAEELRAAHLRGVRVRVILDAVGAANPFSAHPLLCDAGIEVRIENWGGKEHLKACAADGRQVVLGSMNWTNSGDAANDENTLVFDSPALAAAFVADFDLHWDSIPERFVCSNPRAESHASGPFACSDGIDNDFDGFTDGSDSSCSSARENTDAACNNGVDDDGDALIDAEDPNCDSWWPDEDSVPACNDGLDQDGDGFIDADDSDCAGLTVPPVPEAAALRVSKSGDAVFVTWDAPPAGGHSHLLRTESLPPAGDFTLDAVHRLQPSHAESSPAPFVAFLATHAVEVLGDCDEPLGEVHGP